MSEPIQIKCLSLEELRTALSEMGESRFVQDRFLNGCIRRSHRLMR